MRYFTDAYIKHIVEHERKSGRKVCYFPIFHVKIRKIKKIFILEFLQDLISFANDNNISIVSGLFYYNL